MQTIETSHLPSADDISLDSLQDLFEPASAMNSGAVPWVEICNDSKGSKLDLIESQAQVGLLERQMAGLSKQLQKTHVLIGYMQGLVDERDEQLKALPDLRFRAAEAVALRLEAGRCHEKIKELEEQITRLDQSPREKLNEIFRAGSQNLYLEDASIEILSWLGLISLSLVLLSMI